MIVGTALVPVVAAERPVSAQVGCVAEAGSEAAAVAAAEACDGPVVVGSSWSEFARVVAQPDGGLTFESGVVPLWARRADGGWADVDLRLSRGGDGRLRPAVSVADVAFSGGGVGPLVLLTREGRTFTVGWPGVLPVPSVSGDTATYAEVLPGVDLVVEATRTGFAHLLVVKTVEAAANPAVRQIHFDLGGDARAAGLPDGSLRAQVNAQVVASAEPAVMWNSAGQTSATGRGAASAAGESTADGPAGGAETAPVRTVVTADGDLVLTPDAEMLAGAPEEFPVFIDPAWSVRQNRWAYATDDGCSNADFTVARMGYSPEGPCVGSVFRSFFQFPTAGNGVSLAGKHIADAYVQMNLTHSYSCDDTWAYMYQTPVIDHTMKANWSAMTLGTLLDGAPGHANEAGGCDVLQPDMTMNFDSSLVIDKVQAVADKRATSWTVGFSARDSNGANEGTLERWKKFVPADAKLIVDYDSKPGKPTGLQVAGVACPASGAVGIGTLTPTFSAVYPDADTTQSLTGTYEWVQVPAGGIGLVTDTFPARLPRPPTASAPANGRATTVSVTGLTAMRTYAFRVTAVDPYSVWSGWSVWCQFTVDNEGPPAPTITAGGVGGPGTPVTFQASVGGAGAGDVTKFRYSWTGDPAATARVRAHPGTGTGGLAATWSEPAVGWQVDGSTVFSPGDMSGDGKPDVVFRRVTDHSLQLVTGDGTGGFTGPPQVLDSGNWSNAQYLFSPGDFSGDGRPDLLYRSPSDMNLYLRRGAAGGGLESAAVQVGTSWAAANWIFSPGDFSGDGKPDVLYRSSVNSNLYMVRGNGAGGWVTGSSEQIGTNWGACELLAGRGDFSGDGRPDLLYRHKSDNGLRMMRGNAAGGWVTGKAELVATEWGDVSGLVTPGDFTGDGKRDVLAVLPTANFGEVTAVGTTVKTAQVTVMVPGYGQNTLWVRGIDSTGNLGHLASNTLDVVAPALPTAMWGLEIDPGRSQAEAVKDLRPAAPDDDGRTDLTASNVTWRADARLVGGQTASFNGSSSYLQAEPQALDTSESFSVAAWVILADKSVDRTVLAKDANGNESLRLRYQQSSDRWLARVPSAATGTVTWSDVESTTAPAVGVWTHLAVAYDSAARTFTLYVNGMVEARVDGVATFDDATRPFWVGRSKTTWWKGEIADVQVFDRTLVEHDFTGQMASEPGSGGGSHPGVLTPTQVGEWVFSNAVPCWEPVVAPRVCEAADSTQFGRRLSLSQGVNVGQGHRGLGLVLNGTWDLDPSDPRYNELNTTEYGWSQTNTGTPQAPVWQDGTVLRTDDSYTVSVWAYRDNEAGEQTVLSQRGNAESAFSIKYTPDDSSGEWRFIVSDDDGPATTQASVESPATAGEDAWVHLVGVYDAARSQIRLYVQGQPAGMTLLPWTPMASTGPLQVGRTLSNGASTEYWHGGVDDLRVYQGAMTNAQVDALHDEQAIDMPPT